MATHVGSKHRDTFPATISTTSLQDGSPSHWGGVWKDVARRLGPWDRGEYRIPNLWVGGLGKRRLGRDILLTVCFGKGTKNTEWNILQNKLIFYHLRLGYSFFCQFYYSKPFFE